MLRILWLAPNFNHYKARFLNHLASEKAIDLTILSGTGRSNMGDEELEADWSFNHIRINVTKKKFGKSKIVKKTLKPIFKDYDWVLIPAEKKNLYLFLHLLELRKKHPSTRLFSYNHVQLKSKHWFYAVIDTRLTKFFYANLDRIIFYTEDACKMAIKNRLLPPEKAFWANNTLDNIEIEKYYTYQLPPKDQLTLVFIGRLIPSKRVADLIEYYQVLKQKHHHLKLEIIGDGPEYTIIEEALKLDDHILWHKTLVDESKIAPIMSRASLVFVPGLSGLSINHAFAYGRPYITLKAAKHGPEISYLENGKNGYILTDNLVQDVLKISELLTNRAMLQRFCDAAKEKGEYLSVQKWVEQLKANLLHES